MNPTAIDCEILDFLSRRTRSIRWFLVPPHWRRRMHTWIATQPSASAWIERVDVRHVAITPLGRALAAAYRHGRAALAPGQRDLVSA